MTSAYAPSAPAERWEGTLTPSQAAVAELVADGLSNRVIARRLFVQPETVKYHVGNALRRTGTHSRAGLARWWVEHVTRPDDLQSAHLRQLIRALWLHAPASTLTRLSVEDQRVLHGVMALDA